MTPVFKIKNQAEFEAMLKEVGAASSRTMDEVITGQAVALGYRAVKLTKRADKNRIEAQLGAVATWLSISKTGKYRRRKSGRLGSRGLMLADNSLAARIVNARHRARSEPMAWGKKLEQEARALIAARKRSVGYIASGWIWAIRRLKKGGMRIANARAWGLPKGGATKKTSRFKTQINMHNSALIEKFDRSSPVPVAEVGLIKALAVSVRDMEQHLQRKMQQTLNRF